LQAYLSTMTELILDHDLADAKVVAIAQARTISLLSRLDGNRRAAVLEFLASAGLIAAEKPTIRLSGADLSNMQAVRLSMTGVSLSGANLSNSRSRVPRSGAAICATPICRMWTSPIPISSAPIFAARIWRRPTSPGRSC
jgi:uncharacterized protein YjbI with pentapeptide repeats